MNTAITHAVAADTIFDGTATHHDAAVVVEGARIIKVLSRSDLPRDMEVDVLPAGAWLAPGFIDIQVNGGGDLLFNDAPTSETIMTMVAAHRQFGTTSLLPTLISDSEEKMWAAQASIEAMVGVEPSVLGIHLEGPFLSTERAGVHDASFIREPGPSDVDFLCRKRKGAMLITLAPERVPRGFIKRITQSGACVALGHSMATYDEALGAMAEA